MGAGVRDVVVTVGVHDSTYRAWRMSAWWPEEIEKARQLVPDYLRDRALAGLCRSLSDPREYAVASRWIAERTINYLAPPQKRTDLTSGGQAIPTNIEVSFVRPDEPGEKEGES